MTALAKNSLTDVLRNLMTDARRIPRNFYGNSEDWLKGFSETPHAEELHLTRTEAGLDLGLWRYRPRTDRSVDEDPVLLVHGLGSNNRTLALHDRYGLEQYLANRGYDCPAVDLRGRGGKRHPRGKLDLRCLPEVRSARCR